MPLSDVIIILIGSFAVGTSIFAIYLVMKFIKEMKGEETIFEDRKAREVKKTYDFLSKKEKVGKISSISDKPKKTFGEVQLEV